MPIKNACFDWNGTLFIPETDESLNKAVAHAIKKDLLGGIIWGKFWNIPRALRLLREGKPAVEKALAQYKKGDATLQEVYKAFNQHIIRGTPINVILNAFNQFANDNYSSVDSRMLDPLMEFRGQRRILSTSQSYVIHRTLMEDRYSEIFERFDITANKFSMLTVKDFKNVAGFTLDIYGKKAKVFKESFLNDEGWKSDETIYSGDTEDDLPVADLLPKGHFVAPFLASDDFKQLAAKTYGAFVPESEQDWANYLKKH